MGWFKQNVVQKTLHHCSKPDVHLVATDGMSKKQRAWHLRNGWTKDYEVDQLVADIDVGSVWECDQCGTVWQCTKAGNYARYYLIRSTYMGFHDGISPPEWVKAVTSTEVAFIDS